MARSTWWTPLAFSLAVILAAKLLLIGVFGSPTPFWDQWDGEGYVLFRPWMNGTFGIADLFSAHSEHRIVLSRLLALVLLELAGSWNNILEMVVDALIHVATLTLLLFVVRHTGIVRRPSLVAGFMLLFFAVPLGTENTLWAFQSSFYLLVLISILALTLLSDGKSFSVRWCAGALFGTLSFFAAASGALTVLAAALITAVQILAGSRRSHAAEWLGVGILVLIGGALIAWTPAVPGHQLLKAHGVIQFAWALSLSTGWPLILPLVGPVLLSAPGFMLTWYAVRTKLPSDHPVWRLLTIIAWEGLQAVSIAYGRAAVPIQSRYIDLFALLPVLNLIAALSLLDVGGYVARQIRRWLPAWVAIIVGFAVFNMAWILPKHWTLNPAVTLAQTANVTDFIRSGDSDVLRLPRHSLPNWRLWKPPLFDLNRPYPDWRTLQDRLNDPLIRGVLPKMFGVPAADRATAKEHLLLRGGLSLEPWPVAVAAKWTGAFLFASALALFLFLRLTSSLSGQSSAPRLSNDPDRVRHPVDPVRTSQTQP